MAEDFHILELLPAYALGSLDEAEARQAADHLATCAACRAELRFYEALADQLALAAPEAEPPAALKRRLLDRIQPPPPPAPPVRLTWWQSWGALTRRAAPVWGLISLVLIVGLAIGNLWLWQQIDQARTAISPEGMRAISLRNTGLAPGAAGFILVGTDGQNGAIIVDKLPLLDEAQEYQVWLIRDGQRTSGALFSVDEAGYGGRRVTAPLPLSDYAAIDITIEPAGGSPNPTGDSVLAGLLK